MICVHCGRTGAGLRYGEWSFERNLCLSCASWRAPKARVDDDEPDYDPEKGYRGRIGVRLSPATHRAIDRDEDEKEGLSDPREA